MASQHTNRADLGMGYHHLPGLFAEFVVTPELGSPQKSGSKNHSTPGFHRPRSRHHHQFMALLPQHFWYILVHVDMLFNLLSMFSRERVKRHVSNGQKSRLGPTNKR